MDHAKVNAALGTVHAAQSAQEVAEAYAAWAARYDRETAELGYVLPFLIAAWIGRYVPPGAGPLLDAGWAPASPAPTFRRSATVTSTGSTCPRRCWPWPPGEKPTGR